MIKSHEEFTKAERIEMALQGTSYAMYEAARDKNNFQKYQTKDIEDLSEEAIKDMKILDVLQQLGYPMDELGTYLYKDMIREVYDKLEKMSTPKEVYQYKAILSELRKPFSNSYLYIAREWKEMGIKSFHLYIQKALSKVDEQSSNKKLSKEVYGGKLDRQNYAVNAYRIAIQTLKQIRLSNENTTEHQKKLVRKIEKHAPKIVDRIVINGALKNDF